MKTPRKARPPPVCQTHYLNVFKHNNTPDCRIKFGWCTAYINSMFDMVARSVQERQWDRSVGNNVKIIPVFRAIRYQRAVSYRREANFPPQNHPISSTFVMTASIIRQTVQDHASTRLGLLDYLSCRGIEYQYRSSFTASAERRLNPGSGSSCVAWSWCG